MKRLDFNLKSISDVEKMQTKLYEKYDLVRLKVIDEFVMGTILTGYFIVD